MSAPGIGKLPNFTLPDLSAVAELPKPLKALVYLAMLGVLTVAAIGALFATVVVVGQLTGAFNIFAFL